MLFSAAERAAAFAPFFAPASAFDDELFLAHEEYIARATALLEEMRPILRAIEKRDALLADKAEYETIIADAARLIKGSSAARLREEKLEKRVKKELPAYNKRLRTQIVEFETARGAPFTIVGARFLDVLDNEEAAETKARGDARAQREARQRGDEDTAGAAAAPATTAAPEKGGPRSTSNPRIVLSSVRAPLGASTTANATSVRPVSAKAARPSAPPPAPQPLPAASALAEHAASEMLNNL
jgi:hypothetical protein